MKVVWCRVTVAHYVLAELHRTWHLVLNRLLTDEKKYHNIYCVHNLLAVLIIQSKVEWKVTKKSMMKSINCRNKSMRVVFELKPRKTLILYKNYNWEREKKRTYIYKNWLVITNAKFSHSQFIQIFTTSCNTNLSYFRGDLRVTNLTFKFIHHIQHLFEERKV